MFQRKSFFWAGLLAVLVSGTSLVVAGKSPTDPVPVSARSFGSPDDSTDRYIAMGVAVGLFAFAFARKEKTVVPQTPPVPSAPEPGEAESAETPPAAGEVIVEQQPAVEETAAEQQPAAEEAAAEQQPAAGEAIAEEQPAAAEQQPSSGEAAAEEESAASEESSSGKTA